jgi:hypothetical protein
LAHRHPPAPPPLFSFKNSINYTEKEKAECPEVCMRIFILATALITACTPANVSDNRVMSEGRPNNPIVLDNADAQPKNDSPASDPANAGNPNPALANFLPVAYSDDLQPMVQKLCTESCHSGAPAPGPLLLNTADSLKTSLEQATNAVNSGSMPPNQAELNAADKRLHTQLGISLKNWSRNEAYAASLADFKISYTPAIAALNSALCLSCHSGAQPSAGLRLETQEQWKTAMPKILSAVGNGSMPPKIDDVQGPRLLKFLNAWQDQGFP